MATIIDSLLVTLGLDGSQFEAGRRKVDKGLKDTGRGAEETGKKLKQAGKEGAEGFKGLSTEAGKFLAVLGGAVALKNFVSNIIESTAALDRLSKNLGMSAADVSAWSRAAEIAGGSAEGLQGSLDMLSKAQTDLMLTGQSSLIPYLSALGVAVADASGKARPLDDILLDLSDRFSHLDRTTANNMGRSMGIDQGTMQLLLKGRQEVEATIRRQKEFGAVTKKQAEEASRLREQIVKGKQTFEAFGRALLSEAMPALEKLAAVMEEFGDWCAENRQFVEAFLTVIGVGLGAIAAACIPINNTALAVTALAGAIALLYDDYKTWEAGGESFFNWGKWKEGIDSLKVGIESFRNTATDAFYRIFAAADAARHALKGNWAAAKMAWDEAKNGRTVAADSPTPAAASGAAGGAATDPQAYFVSRGWTQAQAAGIVANLKSESGLRHNATGDNGKAYGIAQWHPDRQANFARWAGKDIRQSTLAEQLAFVDYELTAGSEQRAGAALRGAVTAERAGEIVSRQYERPLDAAGEAAKRGKLARSLYLGIPGASGAAMGAGAATVAQAGAPVAAGARTVETNIGEIKVYTQATDAAGIARDIGTSVDNQFTAQANYGQF